MTDRPVKIVHHLYDPANPDAPLSELVPLTDDEIAEVEAMRVAFAETGGHRGNIARGLAEVEARRQDELKAAVRAVLDEVAGSEG